MLDLKVAKTEILCLLACIYLCMEKAPIEAKGQHGMKDHSIMLAFRRTNPLMLGVTFM